MPIGSYTSAKLRLRAVVGTTEYTSVVGFAANNFAINQIPSATLILPIGRNIATDQIATIHSSFAKITTGQSVKVYLLAKYGSFENAVPNLPDNKEILIFEGKVTGTSWQQPEGGEAQFLIAIQHWLSDLDETSAVSGSSHPGNPAAWTFPMIFRQIGISSSDDTGAGSADEPHFVPSGATVTGADLNDLWKLVLLPRMLGFANADLFDFALVGLPDVNAAPAVETIAALSRMTQQLDGMPLALETAGADADDVAGAIQESLNYESGVSWVNTTLWGKLVGEWAASYFFSVIPRVSDALVVPFTGGLRGKPWAVIGVDDYSSENLNGNMPRVLRAVGLVHPVLYTTGFNTASANDTNNRSGCCGFFQPAGVTRGVILLKDAPRWLCNPQLTGRFASAGTGVGPNIPVNTTLDTVVTPAAAAAAAAASAIGAGAANVAAAINVAAGSAAARFVNAQRQFRSIMDSVAQQWYILESLKGRTGEVGGKLRFDIAPGSNVMLEIRQATNIPAARNALTQRLFATVTSVSYMIDAEAQQAWTGFSLAHLRNDAENTAEGTSAAKPPLYQKAWRGAPLIRGFTPESATT